MTESAPPFSRNAAGDLCAGSVRLADIASELGTPCYVYSQSAIVAAAERWRAAFPAPQNELCYSVKANSNLAVLKLLADAGWGFDIVSGGELARLEHLRVAGDRVRFSGVGKTAAELRQAVRAGVGTLHLESAGEAELLAEVAAQATGTTGAASGRLSARQSRH